ncbi:site-specific integrase [Lacticaseibacillus paracasei subsp. tolerans]|uniref:tyrosine-type recombinase/integrase n=1 Tax=Lacticaseibacillus paracasei TaxID=1597 RepID=UPI0018AD497A|nr:tyrosine-type recombinase/integrase [Lacticaseibacillus paracasei]QPI89297.1 site-specific integrase [Lacticaseibacillus paracasei subsp. tolerans]
MASINSYKLKNGNTLWAFHVFTGTDPRTGKKTMIHRRGFPSEKIAQQEATLVEAEIIKGNSHYQAGKILMADYLNQWINKLKVNVKEGSMIIYRYNLKKYIIPKVGNILLNKYTLKEHQEFISSLFDDGLSLNTVKLINGTLHNALKKAVAIGYISKNPTVGVEFSAYAKDTSKKLHYWTKDQVAVFIEAAQKDKEPMWLPFFVTLIDCGLRVGEAMALRWSDIDFNKNTLAVNATRIYRAETGENAGKIALDRPKTASSKRIDYLTARVAKLLQEQYERHFNRGNIQGFRFSTSQNNDFVFTYSSDSKFGQPIRARATTGAFNRITTRADLPHIRIHDLRHTHAVLMREAGLSLDDIKDDLGHKDVSTTQIYAEISPAKKQENQRQFEKYLNE